MVVRKFRQLLVVIISSAILVMFIGSIALAQKEIELVFWGWPNLDKWNNDVIYPAFVKAHPDTNIKVKFVPMPFDETHGKLFMTLEAGVGAPDLCWIEGGQIQRYIKQGKLWDLTELIAPFRKDFLPFKLYNNSDARGRVFAVPGDAGPVLLYYRKDIFDKYGISMPIKTWDEYIEIGKKLRNADIYIGSFQKGTGEEAIFRTLYHQIGGSYFDRTGRPTLTSPEAKKVVAIFKKMVDADILFNVPLWDPAKISAIMAGKIAAYPMAVWHHDDLSYTVIKPEDGYGKLRVCALPAFEIGGCPVSNLGGSEVVIPAQSKNKEAAWEYLKFYAVTLEGRLAEAIWGGTFSAYLPIFKDPRVYNRPDELFGGQLFLKEFIDALALMPTEIFYHPACGEAFPIIDAELSKIYAGKVSIDEGLNTLQKRLEDLSKKYR